MNILLLNTCFNQLFLQVYSNGNTFNVDGDKNAKHSENIILKIDEVLNKANLKLKDIDLFSIVKGPGSFTGIRIGMSTIKAFMLGINNQKAVQINTMDLIANSSSIHEEKVVLLNAGGINYYVARYDAKNNLISDYACIEEKDIQNYIKNCKIVSVNEIKINNVDIDEIIDIADLKQLELTNEYLKKDAFVDAENLTPFYILKSQAERNLEKVNKN